MELQRCLCYLNYRCVIGYQLSEASSITQTEINIIYKLQKTVSFVSVRFVCNCYLKKYLVFPRTQMG